MSEQPFLFGDGPWIEVKDGNVTGMSIFRRHYSAMNRKPKIHQFVGPGEKMVLLTPNAKALFVWRKFISDAGEIGVNCAVFSERRQLCGAVQRADSRGQGTRVAPLAG